MRLTTEEILHNSFVVTIDNERISIFNTWFSEQNLLLPHKFIGYEMDDRYLTYQFQTLIKLKQKENFAILNNELNIFHALANNASHWSIVQLAMFNEMPFVTIFEDDAKPVENLKERLDNLCYDIPDETDVLRLGYTTHFKRITKQEVIDSAIPHSDNLIVKNFSGSHAYIVFSKYYERFIAENKHSPRCDFDKINPTSDKNVFALKESLFNQVNLINRSVISSWKREDGSIIRKNNKTQKPLL